MLRYQALGTSGPLPEGDRMTMDVLASDPLGLLTGPGLWIGLAVTALFLFAAVRLHRYRGPI